MRTKIQIPSTHIKVGNDSSLLAQYWGRGERDDPLSSFAVEPRQLVSSGSVKDPVYKTKTECDR